MPWRVFSDTSHDGRNVSVKEAKTSEQLEACKAACLERGFCGFAVWRGKAFFRSEPAAELLAGKKRSVGSELHVFEGPAAKPAKPEAPAPAPAAAPRGGGGSGGAPASKPKPAAPAAAKQKQPSKSGEAAMPGSMAMEELMAMMSGLGGALYCTHCNEAITGEHLLVDLPGQGEVPVHEDCYEKCLPVCAWCRVELTDSYQLYKGRGFGVVTLHEKCVPPFAEANAATTSPNDIKSLSKPSQAKAAGRAKDRLFIDSMSAVEVAAELRRRGRGDVVASSASPSALKAALRKHWDDPIVG